MMKPFKIHYTDKNDENESWLLVWVYDSDVYDDDVEPYFEKHYPQFKLYDLDDKITMDDIFHDWINNVYEDDIRFIINNPKASADSVRKAFIVFGDYVKDKCK